MKNSIKYLGLFLLTFGFSCSTNNPIVLNDSNSSVNINKLKESGIIDKNAKEAFIADIGVKGGASFSVDIDLKEGKFQTKSSNGSVAKTSADIQSLAVYLVRNSASTYPLNGDPIGTDRVAGPFILNRNGAGPYTVTFTNVGSSSGSYYFSAVRAFSGTSGTGTELIKINNGNATAWTGTTASTNRVAVSSSGVSVNSSLVVSTTTSLPVTINLEDAIGAIIDANVAPNSGSNTFGAITAN
ncbi:MAG: hypothetical protein U0354_06705 [Candidatus Sericytochromatia bacterium]